jgi:hypothetical protein
LVICDFWSIRTINFYLHSKFIFFKLRNELEKSEALRQNLEYELSLLKCSFNKEKQAFNGKESLLEEINKNFEGMFS